ncbi:MAG TPA: hypothetical protein VKR54_02080 [Candidatus Babeliales bacterium]|jgi:hypothetical protein|nr:hypothetical protein [Candidatus Babeliales bacterium]
MNNKYLLPLFCIIVLALTPACCGKRQKQSTPDKDINTMIELDDSIIEIEETDEEPVIKF